MKKLVLLFFLGLSVTTFAQTEDYFRRHELKFSPLNFKLDGAYEYLLTKSMGLGISINNNIGFHTESPTTITYFRKYFWKNAIQANGFFIELHSMFYTYENTSLNASQSGYQTSTGYGNGFAFGYKYIDQENLIYFLCIIHYRSSIFQLSRDSRKANFPRLITVFTVPRGNSMIIEISF